MGVQETFQEINPEQIQDNVFKLIGSDWMLITAGDMTAYNTMTASWGGLGVLWGKNVAFCFVRPQRFTYQFLEKHDTFTLSFFDKEYRKALEFCGSHSGKNVNKVEATGLTPVEDNGAIYFKEARLVIVCRKIYYQDITASNFLDPGIGKNYPMKDYHRMYTGHIIKCLLKE